MDVDTDSIQGRTMSVRVKICGLTNLEDALCASDAGADMLGFIFTAKSPRLVTANKVTAIVQGLRLHLGATRSRVPKLVGVFVNEDPDVIESIMAACGLDYAQLHGSESVSALQRLRNRSFKALRPGAANEPGLSEVIEEYASLGVQDGPRILVDAYSPKGYGGTGDLADWAYASEVSSAVSGLVLAGGLNPDNVVEAISTVRPWGVDVSSGVESEPGIKNHAKVRRFIEAVRQMSE